MKESPYKIIELTGTSTLSVEDAVDQAFKSEHKTAKNLCWCHVIETRGNIDRGKVQRWQVSIEVGYSRET